MRPMTREGASHVLHDYDATDSHSLMNRVELDRALASRLQHRVHNRGKAK